MSVAIMSEYRVLPGGRAAFLDALRAEHERAVSLGAHFAAYEVTSGGEAVGRFTVSVEFATPVERGEYIDRVTDPAGRGALDEAVQAADPPAALLARFTAQGIPLKGAPPETPSPVVAELRLRITPGRHVDVEAAIDEFKQTRENLGIPTRQWALVGSGTYHGLRFLITGADSFADSAAQQDRINAYSAERGTPNGALSRAQQTGAVTVVESRNSRLIAGI